MLWITSALDLRSVRGVAVPDGQAEQSRFLGDPRVVVGADLRVDEGFESRTVGGEQLAAVGVVGEVVLLGGVLLAVVQDGVIVGKELPDVAGAVGVQR